MEGLQFCVVGEVPVEEDRVRDGHWEVTLFVVMSTCKYAFKTDSKLKVAKDNNLITYGYSYQLRNSMLNVFQYFI